MIYIFDVDGTLTPSRGRMNTEFALFFEDFVTTFECYLITGSDRKKTLEQIPKPIYDMCIKVYQCSGNHVFQGDRELHKNDWTLPDKHRWWLLAELSNSRFMSKTGDHFDQRTGLLNFSVLGRKCSPYGRENYIQWDEANKEREGIAERFNERWYRQEWWDISADLVIATVAGETGIDITPHGFGKEQIVKNFDATKVTYFGDKTEEGGNDFEIARKLRDKGGKVIQVNSWEDTFKCLQKIQNVV
tara:strand:+ start:58 stop:792 length:735 start_codon:yes stop_codon:yes gene_type:complete